MIKVETPTAIMFYQMRSQLGLSYQKFAEHIGVKSKSVVAKIESGETEPKVDDFYRYVANANFVVVDYQKKIIKPNPAIKYLSMMFALNVTPKTYTKTSGDWHRFNFFSQPRRIEFTCIDDNPLGAWGIDNNVEIPTFGNGKPKKYKVANHLRALLDMLYYNRLLSAQGMKHDYIVTDEYNKVFFQKVKLLLALAHWSEIDQLMDNEFGVEWRKYKRDMKINSEKK
jgi:transcriptional regulator with XRE-family HTH domain